MKIYGKDLEFISRILRNGSGIVDLINNDLSPQNNVEYELYPLSITSETYIAIGFNCYIVKIKT